MSVSDHVGIIGEILQAGGIDPASVDCPMKSETRRVRQAILREEEGMNMATRSMFLAVLSFLIWQRAVSTAHKAVVQTTKG